MIEDDPVLHQLYRDALNHHNIMLLGTITGKEGLEKVIADPPDLIILDIMLPGGMNGFDIAEVLKKDPRTKSIPILILTNLDSEKQTALSIGVNDYLVKTDTSMDDVVAKVKKLLDNK